ncbi:hypothetical protein B0J17DRAFT_624401 [Rhizoctonia solani]|nr:hypothetical protein B0J17DRAFT_624401 [Rhizoctonia solani]
MLDLDSARACASLRSVFGDSPDCVSRQLGEHTFKIIAHIRLRLQAYYLVTIGVLSLYPHVSNYVLINYILKSENRPSCSSRVRDERPGRNADVNSAARSKEPVYPKRADQEASQLISLFELIRHQLCPMVHDFPGLAVKNGTRMIVRSRSPT